MTTTITYHVGDVRDILATLDDSSVDLLVTSPPFLALRSYLPDDHPDKHREIGAEPTPAAFIDTLLGLTADWRRVVADWGSIAVEIGDTYSGSGGAGGDYGATGLRSGQPKFRQFKDAPQDEIAAGNHRVQREGHRASIRNMNNKHQGGGPGWPMAKSLCGIPTLYTWSLAYGRNLLTGCLSPAGEWRVRNLLTWTRPNPPVGALGDKFRPATSFVTVATVDERRWFDLDAVRTPVQHPNQAATRNGKTATDDPQVSGRGLRDYVGSMSAGAPPLDWWDANDLGPDELADWQPLHRLPTQPYNGAHYAAFPVALPRRLIEAMCPREVCATCGEPRRRITEIANAIPLESERHERGERRENATSANTWKRLTGATASDVRTIGWTDCGHGAYRTGIVLDPFGGSGTTAVAAAQTGRDAILIDLDHRNVELTRDRIAHTMRIVSEVRTAERVTWTVDADMPGLKGEHPDQLSIFDEAAS